MVAMALGGRLVRACLLMLLVLDLTFAQRLRAAEETGLALWPAAAQGPALGSITACDEQGCAIRADGTLVCWGINEDGQSAAPAGTFTQVVAGMYFSCGLKTDGTLVCWGSNDSGQSAPPTGKFTQVALGYQYACGLKADGTLSWANGDKAIKTFTVPILNDALDEANETFVVSLLPPTDGAVLGSPAVATVTIFDNDPPPASKARISPARSGLGRRGVGLSCPDHRGGNCR